MRDNGIMKKIETKALRRNGRIMERNDRVMVNKVCVKRGKNKRSEKDTRQMSGCKKKERKETRQRPRRGKKGHISITIS